MNPTVALIGLVAVVAVVVVVWRLASPSIDGAVKRAIAEQKIDVLLRVLEDVRVASQADAFNHAIRSLWNSYQRPLATQLIREFVKNHGSVAIAHYWLAQVQSVEPQLAQQYLEQSFLEKNYQPELAASCGSAG